MNNQIKFIKQQKCNTIEDVLHILKKLQISLAHTKIANLEYFNNSYLVITKNLINNLNMYTNQKSINNLDVIFAEYYFSALNSLLNNNPTSVWEPLLRLRKNTLTQKVFLIVLGANAHINHDLALALFNANKKYLIHKSDFKLTSKVFWQSKKEIIRYLTNEKKNKLFLNVLANIIVLIILCWRKKAWNNFIKLNDSRTTKLIIKKNTISRSNKLLFVAKILN